MSENILPWLESAIFPGATVLVFSHSAWKNCRGSTVYVYSWH